MFLDVPCMGVCCEQERCLSARPNSRLGVALLNTQVKQSLDD